MPSRRPDAMPAPAADVRDWDRVLEVVPDLHRYARRLLSGDLATAEDVVQEALLRAWTHRDDWAGAPAPRPWLFTVARRLVVDHHRRTAARPREVSDDSTIEQACPRAADDLEAVLLRTVLHPALGGLSPAHRSTLVHRHYLGLGEDEVALRLGVPRGTVKSRVHHATSQTRAALRGTAGSDLGALLGGTPDARAEPPASRSPVETSTRALDQTLDQTPDQTPEPSFERNSCDTAA